MTLTDEQPVIPSGGADHPVQTWGELVSYCARAVPDAEISCEWTKGYEECKRRIGKMLERIEHFQAQAAQSAPLADRAVGLDENILDLLDLSYIRAQDERSDSMLGTLALGATVYNNWDVIRPALSAAPTPPAAPAQSEGDDELFNANQMSNGEVLETLWVMGNVELKQEEDGGYGIDLEGVECLGFHVTGNTPDEAIEKVRDMFKASDAKRAKGEQP